MVTVAVGLREASVPLKSTSKVSSMQQEPERITWFFTLPPFVSFCIFDHERKWLLFRLLRVQMCKEKAEAETVLEIREHLARWGARGLVRADDFVQKTI